MRVTHNIASSTEYYTYTFTLQADCRDSEVTVNYSTVTSSDFVITAGQGSFTTYPADLFTVDYPLTCEHVLSDTMQEPRAFTVTESI